MPPTTTGVLPRGERARRSPRVRAARTRRRRLVRERPDRDEPRRPRRLRGEDRQAAVDLHRVRGDDLGRRARRRARRRPRSSRTRSARRSRATQARSACRSRASTLLVRHRRLPSPRGHQSVVVRRRRARCVPRSVVDVAPSIAPGRGRPGGGAGEVDGRVAPRAAAEERRVGAARALDEHLLDARRRAPRSARARCAARRRRAARSARA